MADYHPQDTQTEEHPAFLRKRPKEQASRLTLRGHGGALGEQRLVDPIFVLLALLQLPESSLGPLSGALLCAAAARGHFYVAWFWWPAGLMLVGLIGV